MNFDEEKKNHNAPDQPGQPDENRGSEEAGAEQAVPGLPPLAVQGAAPESGAGHAAVGDLSADAAGSGSIPSGQPVQPVQQVRQPVTQSVTPGNQVQPVQQRVRRSARASQPVKQPVQQPVQQPAQQPVKQPIQQPVKQPVQQPAQQPVKQPIHQPVKQPVQQPVQQPVKQPIQQPVKQPVKQPIQQPVKQPIQQPVKQPIQQPVKQPVQQPVKQPVQQPVKQPVQQPVKQPIQQPVKQPVQQPVKQPVQQPVKQPIQQPIRQPIPVIGKSISIWARLRSVWLSWLAALLALTGVVSVIGDQKTYIKGPAVIREILTGQEIHYEEIAEEPADVPETPVPSAGDALPTEELPLAVPSETVQITEPQDNPDGKYIKYGFPVDLSSDTNILRENEPVTFSVDILGGEPPFRIEWFGWGETNLYDPDLSSPWVRFVEANQEAYPDGRIAYACTTDERHVEFVFTPPVYMGSLSMSLEVTDSRGEASEDVTPNMTGDEVILYSSEEWKNKHPLAGQPEKEDFPFMAETLRAHAQVLRWCSEDAEAVAEIPEQSARVKVIGRAFDEIGRKWYEVRLDFERKGYVPGGMLRKESGTDPAEVRELYMSPGAYSRKWFPTDIYVDKMVYHKGEPLAFTAEILGGTPPFEVNWYVNERLDGDQPFSLYAENHPDYPMSSEYTTSDRNLRFTFTPPAEGEGFWMRLVVRDALGMVNYRTYELGDHGESVYIYSAQEWAAEHPYTEEPGEEHFPFTAVTVDRDADIYDEPSGRRAAVLEEKGTPVKVIGRVYESNGDKWYRIRRLFERTEYMGASQLEKAAADLGPDEAKIYERVNLFNKAVNDDNMLAIAACFENGLKNRDAFDFHQMGVFLSRPAENFKRYEEQRVRFTPYTCSLYGDRGTVWFYVDYYQYLDSEWKHQEGVQTSCANVAKVNGEWVFTMDQQIDKWPIGRLVSGQ